MTIKEKFDKKFLMDELDLPSSALEEDIIEKTRWSVRYRIVWKHLDGRHFMSVYSAGATETQMEAPWEYEDEIEGIQVEKKQVTVEKWVPVKCESSSTASDGEKS